MKILSLIILLLFGGSAYSQDLTDKQRKEIDAMQAKFNKMMEDNDYTKETPVYVKKKRTKEEIEIAKWDKYFADARKKDEEAKDYSQNTTPLTAEEANSGKAYEKADNPEALKSLRHSNGADDLSDALKAIVIVVCVGGLVYAVSRK
jgi:hypothetical protein